jgi:hypothetical protein
MLMSWVLPFYIALVFHLMGFSFLVSVKLVFAVGIIFSAYFFYKLARILAQPLTAELATLFYLYAPYRLYDIYKRGSIGEATSFIWYPLLFMVTYQLGPAFTLKTYWLGVVSFSLLLLTHHVVALPFFVVWFLASVICSVQQKTWRPLFQSSLIVGGGLLITAFFWLPRIVEMPATDLQTFINTFYEKHFYSLYMYPLPNMVTNFIYYLHLPSILTKTVLFCIYIFRLAANLVLAIGLAQSIVIFAMIILTLKHSTFKKNLLIKYYIGALLILVFLTTSFSQIIWKYISLGWLQFPWRLYSTVTFLTALLSIYLLDYLLSSKRKFLMCALLILLFIPFSLIFRQITSEQPKQYTDQYLLDTSELYNVVGNFFPKNTNYLELLEINRSNPEFRPKEIVNYPNTATVLRQERTGHRFKITYQATIDTPVTFNTYYFPGWRAWIDNQEVSVTTNVDQTPKGLLQIILPIGMHSVRVEFTQTPIRKLGYLISGVSLLLLALGTVRIYRNRRPKE